MQSSKQHLLKDEVKSMIKKFLFAGCGISWYRPLRRTLVLKSIAERWHLSLALVNPTTYPVFREYPFLQCLHISSR